MHVHINHMFCNESNWGGKTFWSRYMVTLDTFKKVDQEDMRNLLEEKTGFNNKEWESLQRIKEEMGWSEEDMLRQRRRCENTKYRVFNHEVMKWLEDNVADVRNPEQDNKGWCVGSEDYHMGDKKDICIWFCRRKDAMAFIKAFSSHRRPTTYFDYFKGKRRELDLTRKVLVEVDQYSKEIQASIYDR